MKLSAFFLAAFFVTFNSFADEVRTTCFKQSNYDYELILAHEDGILKTLAFGNSDWNSQGFDLPVTKLETTGAISTYLISDVDVQVEIEDKVLRGEEGLAIMENEKFDCNR